MLQEATNPAEPHSSATNTATYTRYVMLFIGTSFIATCKCVFAEHRTHKGFSLLFVFDQQILIIILLHILSSM